MSEVAVAARYRWNLLTEDPAARDRIARAAGLSPLAAQVLVNRDVRAPEDAAAFLPPSLRVMPDPERVPGFGDAIAALERAQRTKPHVLVHGDYDVDGICGSALLATLLRRLDFDVSVHLPDRVQDGYSFGARSLEVIRERGAGLVFAVDNGTSALAELEELAARGVDVIVVDHHLPGERLPPCAALMNPWLGDPEECFPHFCGAGVAWLFAWGALRHFVGAGHLPASDRRFLYDALGLAALATVADVMPLRGPNRAIVSQGLAALPEARMPGLRALLGAARIRGTPRASDVAFRIAPRLNAAGRMLRADLALDLLTAESAAEAERLCAQLEALNLERRAVQERELRALEAHVEEQRARGDGVLFAGRHDAHFGVLGVVANQLMEASGLPTLLWSECTPGVARGSARAPEGCDLTGLLGGAAEHLDGWGGHARAAGFHFAVERADAVGAALRAAAEGAPPPAPPTLEVDAEITPAAVSLAAVRDLARLEPFGEGFATPLFLCAGATLAAAPRPIGDGSHVELRLEKHGEAVRALGWRMAERVRELRAGDRLDAVVEVGVNAFRGRSSVEWTLRDFRSAS